MEKTRFLANYLNTDYLNITSATCQIKIEKDNLNSALEK